jgi:hypothetical protein
MAGIYILQLQHLRTLPTDIGKQARKKGRQTDKQQTGEAILYNFHISKSCIFAFHKFASWDREGDPGEKFLASPFLANQFWHPHHF